MVTELQGIGKNRKTTRREDPRHLGGDVPTRGVRQFVEEID